MGAIKLFKDFLADRSRKNELLKQAYRYIHKHGPVTKVDLIKGLLSKPTTMTRMIEELLENKWIREVGLGPSSGGRPPILYEINETSGYLIGVDISRTVTRIVLTDLKFSIIDQHLIIMSSSHTPKVVFGEVNDVIKKWLRTYDIQFDRLLGIGVGAVGPILRKKGTIVNPESFLASNWQNVNVFELFAEFPVPITVDNGANTAALSEYFYYNGLYKNILYCINGYGIRGGVVHNGKVFYSGQGDTSALGHLIVHANGKVCICGRQGCLAAYSSLIAMIEELKRTKNRSGTTFKDFLQFIQDGDEDAVHIAKKAAFYFGVGLANMINSLRPELVVLHGPLVYETSFFLEDTVRSAQSHIFMPDILKPAFKKGSFKEEGIALGGAMQMFHSYFTELPLLQ